MTNTTAAVVRTETRAQRQARRKEEAAMRHLIGSCARVEEDLCEAHLKARKDGLLVMSKELWADLNELEECWYRIRTCGTDEDRRTADLHFSAAVAGRLRALGYTRLLWEEVLFTKEKPMVINPGWGQWAPLNGG